MPKPRATISKDGLKRIDLRLEPIRLTAGELAALIVSGQVTDISRDLSAEEWVEQFVRDRTVRDLLALAKAEVLVSGLEMPHYRVADNGCQHHQEGLAKHLDQLLGLGK